MSAAPTVSVEPTFYAEGANVRVNPTAAGYQRSADAVALEGGGYVVTWLSYPADGSVASLVHAQVYAADGVAVGSEFLVGDVQSGDQESPRVAALAGGGFVIGWSWQIYQSVHEINAQRYDSTGHALGDEIAIGTAPVDSGSTASIDLIALSSGGFAAVWHRVSWPSSPEPAGRVYDADGEPLGAAFDLSPPEFGGTEAFPEAGALSDGGFVVAWFAEAWSQDAAPLGVFARRFDAAGQPVGAEFSVATGTGNVGYEPAVTGLAGGGFVVTWSVSTSSGSNVEARIYDATGAAVGGEITVEAPASGGATTPTVTALPDGGFAIAWRAFPEVHLQRFEADGTRLGDTVTPNVTVLGDPASIIATDDGELIVFWQWGHSATPTLSDIYAQRYQIDNRATEQVGAPIANQITVGDDGIGSNVVTVTLSVDIGQLTITTAGSGVTASGNGTASVALTGTVTQLNALLTGGSDSRVSYLVNGDAPPGDATLTVQVRDVENQVASASTPIVILAVGDPAVARPDAAATTEAASKSGNLFADNGSGADADPDGPALSVAAVNGSAANVGTTITLASGALLTVQANGNYLYNPNGVFNALPAAGSGASNLTAHDSFSYTLANGGTATVTITLTGLDSDDTLEGTLGNDTLNGGIGNDSLEAGVGADSMTGGSGDDRFYVDDLGDVIIEGADGGTDTVIVNRFYYELNATAQVERMETFAPLGATAVTFHANDFGQTMVGNAGANEFHASGGNDTLLGGGGDDVLFGDDGNDEVRGEDGNDYLVGGLGNDSLIGGVGNDEARGMNGDDVLRGDDGADALRGGFGADDIHGGDGNDTIRGDETEYSQPGFDGSDMIAGDGGDDLIYAGAGNDTITGGAGFDQIHGGVGQDHIDGGDGDDSIYGLGIDRPYGFTDTDPDSLLGGAGNDRISASYGDSVDGGTGDDSLELNFFHAPAGVTADLRQLANNGTLIFGGGVITNIEFVSGFSLTPFDDTVIAGPIPVGTEGITLDGLGGNDHLTGTSGKDRINGGEGDDILRGNGGLNPNVSPSGDRLYGEAGNDTIYIGPDSAIASGDSGDDIVYGGDGDDNIHGDTGTDQLYGGGGDDGIDGGDGDDALFGGEGDDFVDGGAGTNQLSGGGGNDTLWGGDRGDTMAGGTGNDTYHVFSAAAVVQEDASGGADTIIAYLSYTLEAAAEIETLRTGTYVAEAIDLTGNAFAQTITGNAAANVLDGGGGADTLAGWGGNDSYHVDDVGDVVTEVAGEGTADRVFASVSYALGAGVYVEWLSTSNDAGMAAINLTGNELANTITGNAGANVLDGKGGTDTMVGLAGNDWYYVDSAADVVFEGAGEGAGDQVFASVSYALGTGVHVELLSTASDADSLAINLTGNELANELRGNAGTNLLNGGGGGDTLVGLAGDDLYVVDNEFDMVIEGAAEGSNDHVVASVSYALGAGVYVEALSTTNDAGTDAINLGGNALANMLTGNGGSNWLAGLAGDDELDGGLGADHLQGGTDDDTYHVDNTGDWVHELDGEGTDLVLAAISYQLIEYVENLTLGGSSDIAGGGNALANLLTGNAGNNWLASLEGNDVLDGGLGADRMDGGTDNDTYHVDNAGDWVIENAGEGTDQVLTSISYQLTDNVENLTLTGSDNTAGGGNALANLLTGNAGNNWLASLAGDDVLDGGLGADHLQGGTGNDIYHVDNAGDWLDEAAGEGTDQVLAATSYQLADNVENLTLVGSDNTGGGGNTLANVLTGNAGANWLAGLAGNDLLNGGLGADRLDGGADQDTFAFTSALGGGNVDWISDFAAADDTIALDDAVFTGLATGALASGAFATGAAATEADDRIVYDDNTGALWFDADGSGSAEAMQFATLHPGLTLTSADFLVI